MIIHIAVLAVLLIFGFSAHPPPETEEGILVNFGTDETGFGLIESSPPAVQEETSPPPPSQTSVSSDEKPLLTQNNEEAPAVKKVDPEAEKKRLEKIEADKKKHEEIEAERIRIAQEEAERKRIEAEQQRQSDITNRTKNALANSKNAGTTSTGEGVAGGQGNQGVPSDSVDSSNREEGSGLGDKGISYDLGGRRTLKLPHPQGDYTEEGIVIMEVSVERSGKVTQAVFRQKNSTILDEFLLSIAKKAALETVFEQNLNAPPVQKGTIKYTFKLK